MQENIDPKYRAKVYGALKSELGDSFGKTEQEFNSALDTDSEYAKKVYGALKGELGDSFNKSEDEFYSLVLKKKEESQPTATNQELDSEPKAETGSLDGTETPNTQPETELNKQPETPSQPFKSVFEEYESAYKLTDEQSTEINAQLTQQDKTNSNYSKFKNSWAAKLFGVSGSSAFNEEVKSKKELEEAKVTENKIKFLENLDSSEKTELQLKEYEKINKLNSDNKLKVLENEMFSKEIQGLKNEMSNLDISVEASEKFGEGPNVQGKLAIQARKMELQLKANQLIDKQRLNISGYEKNTSDLQDFETELGLFQKNYGLWENSVDTVRLGFADLMNGLGTLNATEIATLGLVDIPMPGEENNVLMNGKFKEELEKQKSYLRPKKSVENVKSLTDLAEYGLESLLEQAPILATISTGAGGIAALGASQFGNKKQELEADTKKNYSRSKILTASYASAGFETIGAMVDKFALTKGARALKVGIAGGGKSAVKEGVMRYIKPIAAEVGEELTLGTWASNAMDRYYLDKKDVHVFDGTWDTLGKTLITVGAINTIPTLVGDGLSSYNSVGKKKRLTQNLETVKQLQGQLDSSIELTEFETKTINDKIEGIVQENKKILEDTVSIINKLTPEQREQVAKLDVLSRESAEGIKNIENSPNLAPESKEGLIEEFKSSIEQNEKSKEEILENAKSQENTTETEKPKVEETTPESQEQTEGVEDTPSPSIELNPENTNETISEENTVSNEGTGLGVTESIQEQEGDSIQPANEYTEGSGEVQTKRVNPKGVKGEFDVEFDGNGNVSKIVSAKDGREIPKFVDRKVKKTKENPKGLKPVKNANYSRVESEALGGKTDNQVNTENKAKTDKEVSEFEPTNAYEAALKSLGTGSKVSLESSGKETRLSQKETKWASGFKKDADLPTIEALAENIVENSVQELDVQDVRNALIDIITSNGSIDDVRSQISEIHTENSTRQQEQELYEYKNSLSEQDLSNFESIKAEDDYLSELNDNEAIEYLEQQYGGQEAQNVEVGATETTSVQERTGKEKPKTKQERKEVAFDKIDNIAQLLKDALPGIKDSDIAANGFTQDQLIDLMAKSVKHLVGTGIEIDAAIRQVVSSIKEKLNVDIDPEAIKAKMDPDTETKESKPKTEKKKQKKEESKPKTEKKKKKKKKKSVLNRAVEGKNSIDITEAIKSHGLDYETENQKEAKKKAVDFVKAVGIDNALKAARSGKIVGAEKAFVYGEIIDALDRDLKNKDLGIVSELQSKYEDVAVEIGNLINELDIEARGSGRFISALREIYSSSNLKYELSNQVSDYKARNNGEISDEVLEKFTEASEKIKELEQRIKEAEEKLEKAELQSVVDDINDDISQEKRDKAKSRKKAKVIAAKIRSVKIHKKGIFSAASPGSLAFDAALEIVAKSVEAGGTISDAIQNGMDYIKKSDWYKGLSKKDKQEAEETFASSIQEGLVDGIDVTVNEDANGKKTISISKNTLRSFVEQGITDVDQISQLILDEIIEENPELELRDVRDAISGYGKQANLSKDAIDTEIRKLKRLGKLNSAEEDVANGERPKRSGVQRDKISREEAKRKRAINEAIKDLPVDDAALETQWKNALDTVKTRLNNQIEDLKQQIKDGEKRKSERTPLEYDQEAKDLKEKRDQLRDILDSITGKPELTNEQKIQRAENALENNVEKLREDIAKGNIDYKKKSDPLVSAKLDKLRAEQKALKEDLEALRESKGLVEAKRNEARKDAVRKRIAELETRLKNKDFSTRKKKPLVEDQELRELQAEKLKTQEIFDVEKHKDELSKRSKLRKFRDALVNLWGIPRIVLATGEASFVLIQGGIQTVSLATRKPSLFAKNFVQAFKALGSNSVAKNYERLMLTMPEYVSMKNNRLSLTRTDYKIEAQEETFQGDYLSAVWDLAAKGIDNATGKKEFYSMGDTILSKLGFVNLKDKKKVTAGEQFKNVNPIRAIERANTVYMNNLRMWRYLDGVNMLEKDGRNEIDHEQDYKRLAKAVNSLTGRADIGRLENVSDILNTVFFSFRNTVSTFNQLNPIWYAAVLRNSDGTIKPSVAQKIALGDMMRFVGTTTGFMLLAQAAAGKDDNDEWKIQIETDPRSSDFMKLKVGNIRFDPWHGMGQLVTLYGRLISDHTKKGDGEIKRIGEGYKSDTAWDIAFRTLVSNKFSPSTAMIYRYANTTRDKEGKKVQFSKEYHFTDELKAMYPIYWQGLNEIKNEDPEMYVKFLTAIGFFGLNSQVYGNETKKFNTIQGDGSEIKKPDRPKRTKSSSSGIY